jgi:hypothetical protein
MKPRSDHPRTSSGGNAISHWLIARRGDGTWGVYDKGCDMALFGVYKTFRGAWTKRKALMGATSYRNARGLPS